MAPATRPATRPSARTPGAGAGGPVRTGVARTLATPDGPFTMLADDAGAVLASGWTDDVDAVLARLRGPARPEVVRSGRDEDLVAAVEAYYAGDDRPVLTAPVRQVGTALQMRGWALLRTVPAGRPLTYAAFATALGVPTAVRAAAGVCAANAPALFVPCHRVRQADGRPGGFAWGVAVKQALLDREAGLASSG